MECMLVQCNKTKIIIVEVSYLNSLSIVGLYNMEVEAVHAPSWRQEHTALLVKMIAHVHQNLMQQQGRVEKGARHLCHYFLPRS